MVEGILPGSTSLLCFTYLDLKYLDLHRSSAADPVSLFFKITP